MNGSTIFVVTVVLAGPDAAAVTRVCRGFDCRKMSTHVAM